MTAEDTNVIVEQGYDQIADKYFAWATPRPTETRNAKLDALLDRLPGGARVLELGCASGVPSLQTIVKRGFAATGADISAAQIALARKHTPEATLVHGDMAKLEFASASFDAVVSFYTLFHLRREEHGAMVRRIAGWLKPGGYLLFNVSGNDDAEAGDVWRDDWMGVRMFSSNLGASGNREMMRRDGREAGLSVVEDEVHVEKVGPFDEKFHWILAVKEKIE